MHVHQRLNKLWEQTIRNIFSDQDIATVEWTRIDDIVSILKKIGEQADSNHLFFPESGGLDLRGADFSREPGCIELLFGSRSANVVKPLSLRFEALQGDLQACFFRLSCDGLQSTGQSSDGARVEEFLEVGSDYYPRSVWDRGFLEIDFDGTEVPIPDTSRLVIRHVRPASYVIFSKGSRYNQDIKTYDGRHDLMEEDAFRQLVETQYRI
jgi:hypothetical protein